MNRRRFLQTAAASGAADGLKLALNVGAMLIAFVALSRPHLFLTRRALLAALGGELQPEGVAWGLAEPVWTT